MINKIFFACLLLGQFAAGSPLSCRWLDHKFKQHSRETLNLLDTMANNSTNATEAEAAVAFPNHLYHQASKSSAEDKLAVTAQVLEEVAALFEEDHSAASWEESTVRNFLSIVNKQAEELRSCIHKSHKKKNTKLRMSFKRLSHHVLQEMAHSAAAWELIRRAAKDHLMRAEHLLSPLRAAS